MAAEKTAMPADGILAADYRDGISAHPSLSSSLNVADIDALEKGGICRIFFVRSQAHTVEWILGPVIPTARRLGISDSAIETLI